MSVEWLIAKRYLLSGQNRALVSVITIISVVGVAVGVAALMATLAVMDGATDLLLGRMTSLYPHIRVTRAFEHSPAVDETLAAQLAQTPGVRLTQPVYLRRAFLANAVGGARAEKKGVQILGVSDQARAKLYPNVTMTSGQPVALESRQVIIGEALASQLRVKPGDKMRLIAMSEQESRAIQPKMRAVAVQLADTFRSGFYEFDDQFILTSPQTIHALWGEGAQPDYIDVRVDDPMQVDVTRTRLALPIEFETSTWRDDYGAFFSSLKLQKIMLYLILLLITVVAAFNIIGTLVLMVIDKTRDIGILKAMGLSRRRVGRIFLVHGVLIGLIGTLTGVALGALVCMVIRYYPLDMPASVYNFDQLPVKIKWGSVALVAISAQLICTFTSLLPAMHAARLNPVEAIRYD